MGRDNKWRGATYNTYGDSARKVEKAAFEEHGTLVRLVECEIPTAEVSIDGRFVYTTKQKPLKDGYAKTEEYIDDDVMLDARFRVKDRQGVWGKCRIAYIAITEFKCITSCNFLYAVGVQGNGCFYGVFKV